MRVFSSVKVIVANSDGFKRYDYEDCLAQSY